VTSINKITFQANGSPFSEKFNDIYFDSASGFQQSEEVFIKGNEIEQQLLNATDTFTIAETGFGTGLNFLLTLKLYQYLSEQYKLPTLSFISTEKFPLSNIQLTQALQSLPSLAPFAYDLLEQYPKEPQHEANLSFLAGQVQLKILFEDSTLALEKMEAPRHGVIDVWYLDGFSPAKNPEMWQPLLFSHIARLSKSQASISTFTVAGFVRRGLTQVGFRMDKKTSSGDKNQFLIGKFQQEKNKGKGYQIRPTITKPQQVSIVGGGIASACAAYALTKQGIRVTLYCKDIKVAQGASSNKIGALYPLIHQQKDDISLFYQQAFEHATNTYKQLVTQGFHYAHDWCGLLNIAYKESLITQQHSFAQANNWPKTLIYPVDKHEASKLANIKLEHGGLFIPKAGWIAPQELVQQLFSAAKSTNRLRIENSVMVNNVIQKDDSSWQLNTSKGTFKTNVLVMCGGAEGIPLEIMQTLPLTSVRGQVTTVASNKKMSPLATVICHKGYITPENKEQHCIGATFTKNSFDTVSSSEDDDYNFSILERCLPKLTQWSKDDVIASKARLRCMTPDHMPIVGAMPNIKAHKSSYAHLSKDKNWRFVEPAPCIDNLYLLTGLGARGLCTAPLLADILAADLTGSPYPVDEQMLFNLAPNRFIIRDIIRRKFL